MKYKSKKNRPRKKTIFRALFVPLFILLIMQAVLFYVAAVYGGLEETINQNEADIFAERLSNRKNELETLFTKSWTNLDNCQTELEEIYNSYRDTYGEKPLTTSSKVQTEFLLETSTLLVNTLRYNGVNGIFLIVNDKKAKESLPPEGEEKIGLCIRDLDPKSNFPGTEDLLLERSPSAVIKNLECSLDSWWQSRYSFSSKEEGAYYYNPLEAAWDNKDVESKNLSYFEGVHHISDSDPDVVSYSIPLMDENGYPYAVLGVELTTKYLSSLMPDKELSDTNKSCYVLGLTNVDAKQCDVIAGSGSTYSRCFSNNESISMNQIAKTGGFHVRGRDDTLLYGDREIIDIYNNNNPFEEQELTLVALVEDKELFSYIGNVKKTLAVVSIFSSALGLFGLFLVSRRFSSPIKALAKRVQETPPQDGAILGRLDIEEIDQLVHAIEELNRNASRNIARTEFFSRMSHDMRTPMNAIISFSSPEMLEGIEETQKNEYLDKIHSSGIYLLGLINEVLDMTKIESNKIDLQYAPVSSDKLWDVIVPIIGELADNKSIHFHKEISMEKARILVDEQHLTQIVMNLLSNAVKFTKEKGDVWFQVDAQTNPDHPDQLECRILVKDNGIGMSEDFMNHMYRPFEQENESKEGTGLGLSIAQKLITLMGGTITCESKKNEGTTFIVKLAFEKCSEKDIENEEEKTTKEEERAEKTENTDKDRAILKGKRILVCEDHMINMQIIANLLERVGIEVIPAENGKIGLDLFTASEEGEYDCILLDIRMPELDGLETARAIRSLDRKDAKEIPMVAMTANAFTEDVNESKDAGMNAHLSKPIDIQQLYNTLVDLIR